MDDVTPIVAALKKSGLPLQTRIDQEIRARYSSGWRILKSEYPWRSEDDDEFIDLIANCNTVVLLVECKKAQDRALLFLRPIGRETIGTVATCTVWHFEPNLGAGRPSGTAIKDIDLQPASYRAEFCVPSGDKSGQRLLEQEARSVVLAADVLIHSFPQTHQLSRSFFLPVIVTTAPLYTLRYGPDEVSLETGTYNNLDPKEIERIPWVRFHKIFTARPGSVARTVFVVNSAATPAFLDEMSRGVGMGPVAASAT